MRRPEGLDQLEVGRLRGRGEAAFRREFDQQRRMLEDLGRQVRNLPQARQASGSSESQSQELARLRQDIELQRRAVDNVERQLQSFVYQLRSLERR